MPMFRCARCGAVREAVTPGFCPACGAVGEEAFPKGAELAPRDTIEDLFDLEPAASRSTAPGPPPGRQHARLKDRSQPRVMLEAETLEADTRERTLRPPPDADTAPRGPRSEADTLSLRPPPDGETRPFSRAGADIDTSGLQSSSTLELSDADLELAAAPPAPPGEGSPAPAAATAGDTLDLDEGDLMVETPEPPAPASAPRPLRGRVAFPIQGDATAASRPAPPAEVDELAAAGQPPLPPRTPPPLRSQTESLAAIRARQRRRAAMMGLAAICAVVGAGAVYLGVRGGDTGPASAPDVAGAPLVARPDLRAPDSARPDAPRPDASQPDSASPDVRRPPPRPPVAGVDRKRPRPRTIDAGAAQRPAPSAEARAEATARYQDGLRHLLQGRSDEAVKLFNEALAKQPRMSLAYRGLGLAYERLGRKAMARAAFERYLVLAPAADDAEQIRKRIESLKE